MAEFAEVMKQRGRICHNRSCTGCPLKEEAAKNKQACGEFLFDNPDKAEKFIMDWAKEHPEPRYPTWRQYQEQNFPNARKVITICHFADMQCDGVSCTYCHYRDTPIPPDIAKKLGIEPITDGAK